MAKERDHCPSCRKKWVDHYGVIHICKRLKIAATSLCGIQKIASYELALYARLGIDDDNGKRILHLIEETLKKIKV